MRPGAIYMKTKIKPVNWLAPITPSFNAKLLSCKTLQMNFVLKRQNYLKINILLINIATWCIVFHTMWRAIYEQHRSFGHSIPLPARRCSNCCISLQRETKNFTCERCGSKKSLEQSDRWSDTSWLSEWAMAEIWSNLHLHNNAIYAQSWLFNPVTVKCPFRTLFLTYLNT